MLQQLQSPFTFTAPEPVPAINSSSLLLPTPTFSEKSSDSTIYNLQTPISPIKKNQTIIGHNLSMLQSKISLLDDCLLKQEMSQLIENSVHLLQQAQDDNLPQRTYEEFMIQTPPSSFEECTMKTPRPCTNIEEYSFQTPKDRIVDYEKCGPPPPPKQHKFNHQSTNALQYPNIPDIIFPEDNIVTDTIEFNQHFLDWDSFEFDTQELSF